MIWVQKVHVIVNQGMKCWCEKENCGRQVEMFHFSNVAGVCNDSVKVEGFKWACCFVPMY